MSIDILYVNWHTVCWSRYINACMPIDILYVDWHTVSRSTYIVCMLINILYVNQHIICQILYVDRLLCLTVNFCKSPTCLLCVCRSTISLYFCVNFCKTNLNCLMTKPTKMARVPSGDTDQPGHLPSLIRVFAVRMKKHWALSYPLSAQADLGRFPGWSESLPGAQSFCWFCPEATHFFLAHEQTQ